MTTAVRQAAGEFRLNGVAASSGIVIAPAFCYVRAKMEIPARKAEAAAVEYGRFQAACEKAKGELVILREQIRERTGDDEEAAIFTAHLLILEDPMLTDMVAEKVANGLIVEQATAEMTETLAGMLAAMEDELFAARALDVRDVGRRVLRILLGLPEMRLDHLQEPVIIVADDLTPSDTATLDPEMTRGFCTAGGGMTSHSAILARTLGIPAVVGLGMQLMTAVQDGMLLLLDSQEGLLVARPTAATQAHYRQLQARQVSRMTGLQAQALREARTADGRRVEVTANIGDAASARTAVELGAEGVGLLRTEFLYLHETQPPPEAKQVQIYSDIFTALGGKPIIVRTLDIGGDKPPAYLPFPAEMNPFLGWRAIRICLDEPALFMTQLRALLRAAVGHDVRLMFPMINSLDELLAARALLDQARSELAAEGLAFNDEMPVGIMVETPAAAVLVDVLAEAADFFSLGTNDLTQYTLAVDRGNAQVAKLFQPLHPAVLRLIRQTIEAAHANGRWVGMCGELAGMPAAIPILLGLGLDEFSMAPRAIAEAKHLIGALTDAQARQIAAEALRCRTAAEVEAYMRGVLQTLEVTSGA
jgi:phosphotransferase system enzyme I (PtsI)